MTVQPSLRHADKAGVHAIYQQGTTVMSWGTRIVGFLGLGTFFSWLLGNLAQNPEALSKADAYLWQSLVILYFTSWVAGVSLDKGNQEKAYAGTPGPLRVHPLSVLSALLIYGLFALMLIFVTYTLARPSHPAWPISQLPPIPPRTAMAGFVVLVNVLWIVNVPIWRHYVHTYINPMEQRSREIYRMDRDYVGLLKVQVISGYIKGGWQWYRYGVGAVLLAGCDAVLWRSGSAGGVSVAVCLSMAVFLAVVETWIWSRRLKLDHALDCIDTVASEYALTPHRGHHR